MPKQSVRANPISGTTMMFWLFPALIALAVIIFFAIRLPPLINHNVSYTYDQGRDFLAAGSMVINKRPTFLGPTTGVTGLFHGAWWYYVLTIPFIALGGAPIGFYFFNLLLQFAVFILFVYIAYKYAGKLTALFLAFLIGPSPYFILSVVQIGNNIMVIPALAVFIFLNLLLFSEQKSKSVPVWITALLGIMLGLISEFELSFGMFIIPLYFTAIILFGKLRSVVLTAKGGLSFFVGLGLVFLPRLFFELRHEFLQTNTLINFFIKPKLHTPKPYFDVFRDRIELFSHYFRSFSNEQIVLTIFGALLIFLVISVLLRRSIKPFLVFILYMLCGLFFLSTLYKDTFWANYYEGIQLIFLAGVIILVQVMGNFRVVKTILVVLAVLSLTVGIRDAYKTLTSKPTMEGLVKMESIVGYLNRQSASGHGNNCVKVYTPPVIPHTYDYLFMYRKIHDNIPVPETQWIDKKCWFILERDDYKERKEKWMKDQGLDRSTRLYGTKIIDTEIGFYEIKE